MIVAWQNGCKRFLMFLGGLAKLPRNQSYTALLRRLRAENPPFFHAIVHRCGAQLDASKMTRVRHYESHEVRASDTINSMPSSSPGRHRAATVTGSSDMGPTRDPTPSSFPRKRHHPGGTRRGREQASVGYTTRTHHRHSRGSGNPASLTSVESDTSENFEADFLSFRGIQVPINGRSRLRPKLSRSKIQHSRRRRIECNPARSPQEAIPRDHASIRR